MHAEIVHTKVTVLTLSLLFIAIAINGKDTTNHYDQ